ncbi:type 2 isopentenyl-diphosphate Delta-isomerase [Sulfolobales archaeon HS-7]|nr:type 2 isopentenyl-diphosphate Delta-isomerase [Sulfolobales archaeon HS-7]
MSIKKRKMEHIEVTLYGDVDGITSTLMSDVDLVHQAIPGFSIEEINIGTKFLKKEISAPFMITGMTGGSEELMLINSTIAEVAENIGIPMGVGSQRIAIENSEAEESFRIARKKAPSIPLIANIGYPQLANYTVKEIDKLINLIEADALAVHLNVAQEVFQPEGETNYYFEYLEKLVDLSRSLDIPLIVKETGCGISMETANLLEKHGISYVDISGAGGTSWIGVEMIRGQRRNNPKSKSAKLFANWGIPTAASIIETRYVMNNAFIIGSGGIRNGLDVAKAIALGSNISGFALPALGEVIRGKASLTEFLQSVIFELKVGMLLTGSKDVKQLHKVPLVISSKLLNWIQARGIEVLKYEEIRKHIDGKLY